MENPQHPERRLPLRWLASVFVVSLVLVVFPPFHVRPLRSGAPSAAASGSADVPRLAERFWTEKLASPVTQPVDVRTLLTAISQNQAEAVAKYGHRAGIGGRPYFFVGGEAHVGAVDHTGVWLTVDVASSPQLVLITGPIFGNALRDATGLLHIDDFNSFDLNALGAELNRLAETRAQPALRTDVSVGSQVSFLAAGELDDATGDRPVLKLVPIRVTLQR